jgi:hypothetical protein
MEKKNPISFTNAVKCAHNKWSEKVNAFRGDEADWYFDNFVDWISSQGYHIELTGDEFEPFVMSEIVF